MWGKTRLALGLWLLLGVLLWNTIFDYEVTSGVRRYVYLQALHTQGRGPRVTIDEVMNAAVAHGFRLASGWSLAVVACGLAGVGYAARQRTTNTK